MTDTSFAFTGVTPYLHYEDAARHAGTVDHHGNGRVGLTLKAALGDNAALVASDPVKFFMPPYTAHHGYVGIYLDVGEVDWDEVRELILDAYRLAAPKKLAALID